jgi:hypothetical protein
MKDAEGIQWLLLFLSQLIFSPLVQVLIYKYVAATQGWTMPDVGFFRTLLFTYLLPLFFGFFVLIYYIVAKFDNINQGPFFMKHRQLALLTLLSVVPIIFDYIAIVSYSANDSI